MDLKQAVSVLQATAEARLEGQEVEAVFVVLASLLRLDPASAIDCKQDRVHAAIYRWIRFMILNGDLSRLPIPTDTFKTPDTVDAAFREVMLATGWPS